MDRHMGEENVADAREEHQRIDTLFSVLAVEECRTVLRYFQSSGTAVASVDDLVEVVLAQDGTPADRRQVAITLHHKTLPKLADAGFIDHDARNRTVRYRGQPLLERVLDLVTEVEVGT